mmetsp:Transcript_12062/g.36394  ORF Transcript_12062/g.36394 Transcript_12062/m.36394 type:complete len:380 (-) Transcript_12062:987-2126(-)
MRCERPDISATRRTPPRQSRISSMAFAGRLRARASACRRSLASSAQASSSPSSRCVSRLVARKCSRIICGPERCSGMTASWKAMGTPRRRRRRRWRTCAFPTGRSLMVFTCQASCSARRKPGGPSSTFATTTRSPSASSPSSKRTGSPVATSRASTQIRRVVGARKTRRTGSWAARRSPGREARRPCTSCSRLRRAMRWPATCTSLRSRRSERTWAARPSRAPWSATSTAVRPPSQTASTTALPGVSSLRCAIRERERASPVAQMESSTCSPRSTASLAAAQAAGTFSALHMALKKRCCAPQKNCHSRFPISSAPSPSCACFFFMPLKKRHRYVSRRSFASTKRRNSYRHPCQKRQAVLYISVWACVRPHCLVSNSVPT